MRPNYTSDQEIFDTFPIFILCVHCFLGSFHLESIILTTVGVSAVFTRTSL